MKDPWTISLFLKMPRDYTRYFQLPLHLHIISPKSDKLTMESSSGDVASSLLEQEEINDIDALALSPMIVAARSNDADLPELSGFCGSSQTLQMMATNLHKLLTQKGNVKYTEENRKDLELVLRKFVSGVVAATKESTEITLTEIRKSQHELQIVRQELVETNRVLETEKRKVEVVQNSEVETTRENKELRQEIESLQRENAQATQKYLHAKREREKELIELRNENETLKEALNNLEDQVRVYEFRVKKDQKEIDKLTRDLTEKDEEISDAQNKYATKSSKLEDCKRERQKLVLKVESLTDDNERVLALLNQTKQKLNDMKGRECATESMQKFPTVLQNLTREYERQSEEILRMHNLNQKALDIIVKQGALLSCYEQELVTAVPDTSNEGVADSANHIEEAQSCDGFLSRLREITGKETNDEAIEAVESLMQFGMIENRRLAAGIKQEMMFIAELTGSDMIDANKTKMEIELARCRQYITDNVIQGEQEEDDISDPETCLVMQTMRANMLMKYSDKLRHNVEILDKIVVLFEFDYDLEELPFYIEQRFDDMKKIIEAAQKLFKVERETDLIPIMEEKVATLNDFEERLRPALDFRGEASDLPAFATEYISELADHSRMEQSTVVDDLKADVEALERKLTSELENATARVAELEKQLEESEKRLKVAIIDKSNLEAKVEEATGRSEQIEQRLGEQVRTITQMNQNFKDLEEDYHKLEEENSELKLLIKNRPANSQKGFARAISEIQQQHESEIEALHQQFQSVTEKHVKEIQKKTERNKLLKAKIKEIVSAYDKAFQKQKETIAFLRTQMEQMSKEDVNSPIEGPEVQMLGAEVKQLRAENKELRAKLETVDGRIQQAQGARDLFWKTRINEIEEASNERLESERQLILELQAKLANAKTELKMRTSTPTSVIQLDKGAIMRLDEWEKWGRDIYSNVSNGEVAKMSTRDLRFMLGEMVLASIAHRQLLERLRSLRIQKRYFVNGLVLKQFLRIPMGQKVLSIRDVILLLISCVRLQKKRTGIAGSLSQTVTYV